MNSSLNTSLKSNKHHQLSALMLSALVTLVMLGSLNELATSQPPAGLLAQMAATTINT